MPDKKLTDAEVVNGLKCHLGVNPKRCPSCKYTEYGCYCLDHLHSDLLDLINRQKAEFEELEAEIEKQYEQARADILGNMADGGTSCHWCIEEHRSRAIKEFAEKLKEKSKQGKGYLGNVYHSVDVAEIDNLLKEMEGENNG